MDTGNKVAAAIREAPETAVRVIYAIWGLLFGAAALGLMTAIYLVFGPETAGYFLIGLAAAGLLAAGAYALSRLYRALLRLARMFLH